MKNYILGNGELITSHEKLSYGGGSGSPPYNLKESQERLNQAFFVVQNDINLMSRFVCPNNKAVFSIVIHPQETAMSYFPKRFISNTSGIILGSRGLKIVPHKYRDGKRSLKNTNTFEVFVSIDRNNIDEIKESINSEYQNYKNSKYTSEIQRIESLRITPANEKILSESRKEGVILEAILHSTAEDYEEIISSFQSYSKANGMEARVEYLSKVDNLLFIPCIVREDCNLDRLAEFNFLRSLRIAPKLRSFDEFNRSIVKSNRTIKITPASSHSKTKIAVFDGGLFDDHPFGSNVNNIEFEDDPATPSIENYEHGTAVTSALLFGPVDKKDEVELPPFIVDHWHVTDDFNHPTFELYRALKRIKNVLDNNKYDFINLSYGPRYSIDDDDVDLWTSTIDQCLSDGKSLMSIAVGNDGEYPGFDRIQPPSDSVNSIAVGACNREENFKKAEYSCIGPGRLPGFVKPDVLDFGGTYTDRFTIVDNDKRIATGIGTSFASPFALNNAAWIHTLFNGDLTPLTIKAILVHCAKKKKTHSFRELGWGKVEHNIENIIECSEKEITVIYQGLLPIRKFLRAQVPLPTQTYIGNLKMAATICFATEVDPRFPKTYTRNGLEISFRPDITDVEKKVDQRTGEIKTGLPKVVSGLFKFEPLMNENLRQSEAKKWETTIHAYNKGFSKNRKYIDPVIDIHLVRRFHSQSSSDTKMLPYSMILTVQSKDDSQFYNKVFNRYRNRLTTLQPVSIQIPEIRV